MNRTFSLLIKAVVSKDWWTGLWNTSLYTNAFFLIADVAVVSILGFAFWVLAARLYSPAKVGVASATVAAVVLLTKFSRLGFEYGLVRFLPGAGERASSLMNSCFTIVGLTSLVASLVFISGLNLWSPALLSIRHPWLSVFFVLLTIAYTLFLLVEQAFIARRRAKFVLFKNTIAGVVKVAAALVFASLLSTSGIFVSWGLAIFVALAVAIFWFLPRVQPGYTPFPSVSKELVKDMLRFSLGNYIAELLWFAPLMIFPLIVINILGAEMNAYFYIPWTIAQMLFSIPMAVAYSLFAEGSTEEKSLWFNTLNSIKLHLILLVPVVAVLCTLSDKLLLIYGSPYSSSGTTLLRVLALSTIPVGINYISLSVMRVRKNTKGVILLSASVACLALISGCILMTIQGIIGIGVAWIATQTLVAVVVAWLLLHRHHHLASAVI